MHAQDFKSKLHCDLLGEFLNLLDYLIANNMRYGLILFCAFCFLCGCATSMNSLGCSSLSGVDRDICLSDSILASSYGSAEQNNRSAYIRIKNSAGMAISSSDAKGLDKLVGYFGGSDILKSAAERYSEDYFSPDNLSAILDNAKRAGNPELFFKTIDDLLYGHEVFAGGGNIKRILDNVQLFYKFGGFLKVSSSVWAGLGKVQQDCYLGSNFVQVVNDADIGYVVDVQTQNKSSGGSVLGSRLGGAYASALYVDKVFGGGVSGFNYSARSHLVSQLIGGVIGSSLDVPAAERYVHRYTVKKIDGNIVYVDDESYSPLRQSIGVCFSSKLVGRVDQYLCDENVESFKLRASMGGDANRMLKGKAGIRSCNPAN